MELKRDQIGRLSHKEWQQASRDQEMQHFYRSNRYCGECGSTTERGEGIELICTRCRAEIWPKLSPAIVVLILRGERALLVHARNFKGNMHALVAGFVEPGESLEECVEREVSEETGLEICNIRYFGSQTWPFPSQLMIGFTAEWKSGELRFVDGELSAGNWFERDYLPELPKAGSLSRELIDKWIAYQV